MHHRAVDELIDDLEGDWCLKQDAGGAVYEIPGGAIHVSVHLPLQPGPDNDEFGA